MAASTFTLWGDLNQIIQRPWFCSQLDIRNCQWHLHLEYTLMVFLLLLLWPLISIFCWLLLHQSSVSALFMLPPPVPPRLSDYWSSFPNFNGSHVYCSPSPLTWALDPDVHVPTRYPYAHLTSPYRTLRSISNLTCPNLNFWPSSPNLPLVQCYPPQKMIIFKAIRNITLLLFLSRCSWRQIQKSNQPHHWF